MEGRKIKISETGTFSYDGTEVVDILAYPSFLWNTETCKNHYDTNSYILCFKQNNIWVSTYHLNYSFYMT